MGIEDHDLTAEENSTYQQDTRRTKFSSSLGTYRQHFTPAQSRLLDLWLAENPDAESKWVNEGHYQGGNTGDGDPIPGGVPNNTGFDDPGMQTAGYDGTGSIAPLGMNLNSPIPGITQPLPTKWQLGAWAAARGEDPAGLPTKAPAPVPYGHISTLAPDQAKAYAMLMLIQNHSPIKNGPARAAL